MSLSAAAIRLMAAKGMSAEDIAEIAEAMEGPVAPLSPGALRTRKWRANKAQSVTGDVTVTDHGDVSHVGEPAQVVNPTSSLRSEGKPPTHPSGAPPAKPKRSRSCPDDWSPDDRLTGWATGEGFTPGEIERELAKFRDHEFRDPHADWPKAFRNWLRKSRQFGPRLIHERPHPDAKFDRKQANLARAFASAERVAGQRWEP